jgi:hypothetical protein
MTKIRTFAEAMEAKKQNSPEEATFNIMGYNVSLKKTECQNYENTCKHIAEQAPPELLADMTKLDEEEYVNVVGSVMSSIYAKFGIDPTS